MSKIEVMDIDLMIPGCPPRSDVVAEAVLALLRGDTIELPSTNLCEVCPREKPPAGLAMDFIKRQFELGAPEDDLCLISQGLVCMGPATVSLCGENVLLLTYHVEDVTVLLLKY